MKKIILFILVLIIFEPLSAQQKLTEPTFPKGNIGTQLEALPYYNQAVDFLILKDTVSAKKVLYKAFSISFDLVETQLLLGDILYDQNKLDSALYFYKGGIDFAIEQAPHFYFRLFETAHLNGEYDVLHHFLKTFQKFYGKQAEGKYEEEFEYTVNDKEFYLNCDDFIHNFENWLTTAQYKDTLSQSDFHFGISPKGWFVQNKKGLVEIRKSRNRYKKSKIQSELNIEIAYYDEKTGFYFLTIRNSDSTKIAIAKRDNNKWKNIKYLPNEINKSSWTSYPFYNSELGLLYFSDLRNGNKDLFVVKYDSKNNICEKVESLNRLNTDKDEIAPFFKGNTFYFSSNGKSGFGGFDLYYTNDSQTTNQVLKPMNGYNLGTSYNSWNDELQIITHSNKQTLILQRSRENKSFLIEVKLLNKRNRINLDSHLPTTNTTGL
jgi:hypothetical protein